LKLIKDEDNERVNNSNTNGLISEYERRITDLTSELERTTQLKVSISLYVYTNLGIHTYMNICMYEI
jgi:hypothetical protein